MEESKDITQSNKLMKHKSNPKIYWSVLKKLLNNKKHKSSHHCFEKK